ncbi:MAG: 3-dehydroquinate synthase family protein, partial [Flavobacteriaceae bacterium]|nr:3-dehydroquinate synthase family protein [Flavobacteriaceae bacterium]
GVITDLGGMVAALYKRGLPFIHVPTTVLGMVDAAIGGKNGVDFMGLKNQIGSVSMPELVWIAPNYIDTLNKRQLINGFAEMLKHALIADQKHWQALNNINPENPDALKKHILTSALIKKQIVQIDPFEKKGRLFLNFGHTIGHAIESALIQAQKPILHGEAVALGMLLESYLSTQLKGLSNAEFLSIKNCLLKLYPQISIDEQLKTSILAFIKHDKKALSSGLRMVLLESIGKPVIQHDISNKVVENCLNWYQTEIGNQLA